MISAMAPPRPPLDRAGVVAATGGAVLAGAAMIIAQAFVAGLGWTTPAFAAFAALMGAATVTDLQHRIVPNRLAFWGTVVATAAFVAAGIDDPSSLGSAVAGSALLGGIFFVIHVISPKGFGAADVKLGFVVGLATAWFGLVQIRWLLLFTWVALAAVGIPLILKHGRRNAPTVPFIPMLALGAVVTILRAMA